MLILPTCGTRRLWHFAVRCMAFVIVHKQPLIDSAFWITFCQWRLSNECPRTPEVPQKPILWVCKAHVPRKCPPLSPFLSSFCQTCLAMQQAGFAAWHVRSIFINSACFDAGFLLYMPAVRESQAHKKQHIRFRATFPCKGKLKILRPTA